jgi:hypothetical protein
MSDQSENNEWDESTAEQRLGGELTEHLLAELQRRGWKLVTNEDALTRDDAPAYFLYKLGALT